MHSCLVFPKLDWREKWEDLGFVRVHWFRGLEGSRLRVKVCVGVTWGIRGRSNQTTSKESEPLSSFVSSSLTLVQHKLGYFNEFFRMLSTLYFSILLNHIVNDYPKIFEVINRMLKASSAQTSSSVEKQFQLYETLEI